VDRPPDLPHMSSLSGMSLDRDAIILCMTAFLSDIMFGILGPTFSLFVVSIGGSLAVVGALSSIINLTRLVSTFPAGLASDLLGRKRMLALSLALLIAGTGAYGLVSDPRLLFLIRVVEGLGMATFFTGGMAALSDAVPVAKRSTAIGVYMTALGSGYALGGVLGGFLTDALGFAATYRLAALMPVAGLVLVTVGYRPPSDDTMRSFNALPSQTSMRQLSLDRYLLPANLGNFLIGLTFLATVLGFFPLYAASVGIRPAVLGVLFGVRSLLSTAVRLPTGLLATPDRTLPLMSYALALAMVAMWLVPATGNPLILLILLCAEGIAYGSFVTTGQAHVTTHGEAQRGMVLGVYATFSSLGCTVGSLMLGVLAEVIGLSAVFHATGIMLALGLAGVWLMGRGGRD